MNRAEKINIVIMRNVLKLIRTIEKQKKELNRNKSLSTTRSIGIDDILDNITVSFDPAQHEGGCSCRTVSLQYEGVTYILDVFTYKEAKEQWKVSQDQKANDQSGTY